MSDFSSDNGCFCFSPENVFLLIFLHQPYCPPTKTKAVFFFPTQYLFSISMKSNCLFTFPLTAAGILFLFGWRLFMSSDKAYFFLSRHRFFIICPQTIGLFPQTPAVCNFPQITRVFFFNPDKRYFIFSLDNDSFFIHPQITVIFLFLPGQRLSWWELCNFTKITADHPDNLDNVPVETEFLYNNPEDIFYWLISAVKAYIVPWLTKYLTSSSSNVLIHNVAS